MASKGFLTESEIKDMDANYRWETYNKVDKYGTVFNTLLDPRSKEFLSLKRNIEARVGLKIYHKYNKSSFLVGWTNGKISDSNQQRICKKFIDPIHEGRGQ